MVGFFLFVFLPLIFGVLISLAALIFLSLIDWIIDDAFTECDMLTMERYKDLIYAYSHKHNSSCDSFDSHNNSDNKS